MSSVFYSENDPRAAAWLRGLIRADLIPAGVVDERSIADVSADDLRGFGTVHLFAGIGGWAYALRLAGWPDDRPVWTGSCPCQPFSAAGKRKGESDSRHLWPTMRRLVAECRPSTAFGEQVASKAGREWLAGVRADLEELGYAVGCADLCAASAGAPHIRQRLFWVADSTCGGEMSAQQPRQRGITEQGGHARRLADSESQSRERTSQPGNSLGGNGEESTVDSSPLGRRGSARGVVNTGHMRRASRRSRGIQQTESPIREESRSSGTSDGLGNSTHATSARLGQQQQQLHEAPVTDFWRDFDLIPCRDGKTRRVEPGTFPLDYGVPGRVGLLRGYGNAIVPQVAAEFIRAWLDINER